MQRPACKSCSMLRLPVFRSAPAQQRARDTIIEMRCELQQFARQVSAVQGELRQCQRVQYRQQQRFVTASLDLQRHVDRKVDTKLEKAWQRVERAVQGLESKLDRDVTPRLERLNNVAQAGTFAGSLITDGTFMLAIIAVVGNLVPVIWDFSRQMWTSSAFRAAHQWHVVFGAFALLILMWVRQQQQGKSVADAQQMPMSTVTKEPAKGVQKHDEAHV